MKEGYNRFGREPGSGHTRRGLKDKIMRLVHLSDLHLGYRAYSRITDRGINQREQDVFEVFQQALEKVFALDPDLIVITGDVFHTVRPGNFTLISTYRFLSRFQKRRQARPLLLLAGNHETPRSAEVRCILGLFENIPGVIAVSDQIRWIEIGQIALLCIPARGVSEIGRTSLHPNPAFKVNLLLVHGILEGLTAYTLSYPVPRQVILNDRWDYIGLGDYHLYQPIAPNAYYAGSTEFTSSNIWEEISVPKGFIEFDTERRQANFHRLETRKVIDLPVIDALELSAQEVNDRLLRNAEQAGVEDAIVRQRVFNLRYEVRREISAELLRQLRTTALHYYFDPRPPKLGGKGERRSLESHERRTLEQEWRAFLADYPLPKEVNRERLIQEGLAYLSD